MELSKILTIPEFAYLQLVDSIYQKVIKKPARYDYYNIFIISQRILVMKK